MTGNNVNDAESLDVADSKSMIKRYYLYTHCVKYEHVQNHRIFILFQYILF